MDYYCIRCYVTTCWCRIAVVVDDFGFMRWNHASFGRPGTCRRVMVLLPRMMMTVVIVLLLLVVMVLLMATVAATAVR